MKLIEWIKIFTYTHNYVLLSNICWIYFILNNKLFNKYYNMKMLKLDLCRVCLHLITNV